MLSNLYGLSTNIKNEQLNNDNARKPSILSYVLEERFANIEQHLNLPKDINPKNIHHRLKAIESRILHLESISPEYKHFVVSYINLTCIKS